jgi:hypothetical protein
VSFLGDPCPCGWALTETSEVERACERCGRKWVRRDWGWEQVTPLDQIVERPACHHNRVVGELCPHCPGGKAVEP